MVVWLVNLVVVRSEASKARGKRAVRPLRVVVVVVVLILNRLTQYPIAYYRAACNGPQVLLKPHARFSTATSTNVPFAARSRTKHAEATVCVV